MRCFTGNQCKSMSTGVMWNHFLARVTSDGYFTNWWTNTRHVCTILMNFSLWFQICHNISQFWHTNSVGKQAYKQVSEYFDGHQQSRIFWIFYCVQAWILGSFSYNILVCDIKSEKHGLQAPEHFFPGIWSQMLTKMLIFRHFCKKKQQNIYLNDKFSLKIAKISLLK